MCEASQFLFLLKMAEPPCNNSGLQDMLLHLFCFCFGSCCAAGPTTQRTVMITNITVPHPDPKPILRGWQNSKIPATQPAPKVALSWDNKSGTLPKKVNMLGQKYACPKIPPQQMSVLSGQQQNTKIHKAFVCLYWPHRHQRLAFLDHTLPWSPSLLFLPMGKMKTKFSQRHTSEIKVAVENKNYCKQFIPMGNKKIINRKWIACEDIANCMVFEVNKNRNNCK